MESAVDLKLQKVVLFKVGIGSFQKRGQIDLSQVKTLRLSFKDSVMNDLLKTFCILRLSGDMLVSGVSYEAKDTNKSKLLEESLINLPEQNSFSALIRQLRGINVRINQDGNILEGKVLGSQRFKGAPTGQAIIDTEEIILAFDNNEIRPIPITEITGLEILDTTVDKDLKYFLETIIGENKEKNKPITIFFEGETASEFLLNFLQETPAWKTSYRIYVEDQTESNEEEQVNPPESTEGDSAENDSDHPFKRSVSLQSWAIIDNVLDEDWENVDLTLVTGLPISFIYDSYSPAWITRPTVERKTATGVRVVQYERDMLGTKGGGGYAGGPKATLAPPAPPGAAPARAQAKRAMKPAMNMFDKEMMSDGAAPSDMFFGGEAEESILMPEEKAAEQTFEAASETEGGKGLAFKYHIKNPVFVKRNNSSLIPIFQSHLDGLMVSVYNRDVDDKHPLSTIEFTNLSGTALEEGPISVFFNKNFAGEAMIPFLETNAKGRIPYAIDQAVEVVRETSSTTSSFHQIVIKDYIYFKYYRTSTTIYKLKNFNENPRKVIVEHPKSKDYKLFETVEPAEETASFYRFTIILAGSDNAKLEIKERKLDYSSESSQAQRPDLVEEWFSKEFITEAERDYLLKRIELYQQQRELQDHFNQLNNDKSNILTDQDRLRENLKSLKQSSAEKQLRDKYIQKMNEQETKLEEIDAEMDTLSQQIHDLDKQMTDLNTDWVKNAQTKSEA